LKIAFLALGSNLGDREAHLRRAVAELAAPELRVLRVSPVYETSPQGMLDQGWFLNLVLEAQTSLMPVQLLRRCQRVERLLKRQRRILNGPRTIDIDVLFYGNAVIRSPMIEIPHPRYRERRFVLQPLADLECEWRDPATGKTVQAMLKDVAGQSVRQTGITIGVA
jgi:2-amino-4-hydroxy-6-hydroxymethyldihydropteridine diphosphokinase